MKISALPSMPYYVQIPSYSPSMSHLFYLYLCQSIHKPQHPQPPSRMIHMMPPIHLQPKRHKRHKTASSHKHWPPKRRDKLPPQQILSHRPIPEEPISQRPQPEQLAHLRRGENLLYTRYIHCSMSLDCADSVSVSICISIVEGIWIRSRGCGCVCGCKRM